MAVTATVGDIYNTVCDALCEPWQHGAAPGLSLGVFTQAQFLSLFAVVLEDFVNRTGLAYGIFTQTLNFGTSAYLVPPDMNDVKVAFIGGQWINHSTLFELDQWEYNWRSKFGTPEYWHEDGLAPKTIEVAANPDYNGAGYLAPTGPTVQPPYGISGLFNGSTQGQFTGTGTMVGSTFTWNSGALFDANWSHYYPLPNISLSGSPYPIQGITSQTVMVLAATPGDGLYNFTVSITNDGNLTLIGTQGLTSITYTLDQVIPVLPDSFCFYLAYGVLARVFSTDGETKDLQRAAYCNARYTEGANAGAAISGQMAEIG